MSSRSPRAHLVPELLPAGVHLLPVLRSGDDARLIVVCDASGHALAGPQWVDPALDIITAAARLLAAARARQRNDEDSGDGEDGEDSGERVTLPRVWREPSPGREIL